MITTLLASELHKMIPGLQFAKTLRIALNDGAHRYNPFTLIIKLGTKSCPGAAVQTFQIDLPHSEGKLQGKCHDFLNSDVCSFLRAHVDEVQSLHVFRSHLIPNFLSNLLAAMGGKGVTRLAIYHYAGDIFPPESGQETLDVIFRELTELAVFAAEDQIEDASHVELGRLISVSSNLETLQLESPHRLTDAGLINIMSGLCASKKMSHLFLKQAELGLCKMDTLLRFFDILNNLPSLEYISFMGGSISLEGTDAAFFWKQLLRLPKLCLTLSDCHIPDSLAPLLQNLLVGSQCGLANLELYYEGSDPQPKTMLEAFYRGVAQSQSIKTLGTRTYHDSGTEEGRALTLAICDMIEVNTSLRAIHVADHALSVRAYDAIQDCSMHFNALCQNLTLTNVHFEMPGGCKMNKESATAIELYLESSTVLETFRLDCCVINLEVATHICNGIRKSKSVRRFYITGHATPECYDVFVAALAENSNIVDASFCNFQNDLIDYYLALNRYGCKYMLDPSFPTKLLPLVFQRQCGTHTTSCIYNCLRESPHFVRCNTSSRASQKRPLGHDDTSV